MADILEDNPAIRAALDNLRTTIASEFAEGRSTIKRWRIYAIDKEGNHGNQGAGCTCLYCSTSIAMVAAAGMKGTSAVPDFKAVH